MTTPKKAPAKKAAAPDQGQATRTGPSAREAVPPAPPEEVDLGGVEISQWEFVDKVPTREAVVELLATLPPVWGVNTVDFADYVQVLPQRKKISVPREDGQQGVIEKYLNCYTVYMSVAGRIAMLNAAAKEFGWAVEFRPEMGTQVPGFLDMGDNSGRIIYREYVVIEEILEDPQGERSTCLLGSKPGMAWVPHQGGKQAAGSNPYEKVETAARGRALAAWGFGVLPGSGVASVEEVLGARQNRDAMDAQPESRRGTPGRVSRETLLQNLREAGESYRMKRGWEVGLLMEFMGQYLSGEPGDQPGLGLADVYNAEENKIEFHKVSDGNLTLLVQHLRHLIDNGEDGDS